MVNIPEKNPIRCRITITAIKMFFINAITIIIFLSVFFDTYTAVGYLTRILLEVNH